MAPPEAVTEAAPVAFVAPVPVEVAPEPVAKVGIEVEIEVEPDPEPVGELAPPRTSWSGSPRTVEARMSALEPPCLRSRALLRLEELFAPKRSGQFCVVVRLKEGDGLVLARSASSAREGRRPGSDRAVLDCNRQPVAFCAGRFIRPDLIVSVDGSMATGPRL